MYLYDAQTGKLHRIVSAMTNREIARLGYTGNELDFLQKMCYAVEGLGMYEDEEAHKALELRLYYARKLLMGKNAVHDLRTVIAPVLPNVPAQPLLFFAKFRSRADEGLKDSRYIVSHNLIEEPEFGSLEHL